SSGWSPGWENRGGISSAVQFNSNIAATSSTDGRFELFAVGTDNAMYHLWYQNSMGWSKKWESLGKPAGGQFKFGPGASSSTQGRIEVFAVGTDNAMHHKWFHPSSGWSPGWENRGGISSAVQFNSNIAA